MLNQMFTRNTKVSMMSRGYTGFTLAEVLITLGIVGVVAAMTIPVLINSSQDAKFKAGYKKAYSNASNAFKLGVAKGYSYTEMADYADTAAAVVNWQIFSSQFKIVKECIANDTSQCWDMSGEKVNNAPNSRGLAFMDSSGMAWTMRCDPTVVSTCDNEFFLVDTNGFDKPNVFGKDRWAIHLTFNNKVPIGVTYAHNGYVDDDVNIYYCPRGGCKYKGWIIGN